MNRMKRVSLKELQELAKEKGNGVPLPKSQREKFYHSGAWEKLREQVLDRDGHECCVCRQQGRLTGYWDSRLIVHHMHVLEYFPKLAYDIDNLITVCIKCHNDIHGYNVPINKKKWDDEFF